MSIEKRNRYFAILAFLAYFITGAICMLIGSSVTELAVIYGKPLESVVVMSSAMALGRISTVYFTGILAQKVSPLKLLFAGVLFMGVFQVFPPLVNSLWAGIVLSVLGGIGMGVQDTVCPILVAKVYPDKYSSMLTLGQGCYVGGSFAMTGLVGLTLKLGLDISVANIILGVPSVVALILIMIVGFDFEADEQSDGDTVKPIHVKSLAGAFIALTLTSFIYCSTVNVLNLYTTSYSVYMGFSEVQGAFLLSLYNIGGVLGDLGCAALVSKIKEKTVLMLCALISIPTVLLMLIYPNYTVFSICYFMLGMLLCGLYGVILSIFTRVGYMNMGVAGSLMAFSAGAGDFVAPLISSLVLTAFSLSANFVMVGTLLIALFILSVVIYVISKEDANVSAE